MKNLLTLASLHGFLALLPSDARIFWIVTPVTEILRSSLGIGGRITVDQIATLQLSNHIFSTRHLTFRKGGQSGWSIGETRRILYREASEVNRFNGALMDLVRIDTLVHQPPDLEILGLSLAICQIAPHMAADS